MGKEDRGWRWTPLRKVKYSCYGRLDVLILVLEEKLTAKAQKITIKLPWEITTIYSEVLKQSGHQSDDEEDEDDIEAHEASIQRLRVGHNFSLAASIVA
jgi:hypothetical protein